MFGRFRTKGKSPAKAPAEVPENDDKEDEDDHQGFICPMCMASLPGPAELQIHFEKVHSEGEMEEKLIDIDDEAWKTDALPESSIEDLVPVSPPDFEQAHLGVALNSNAADIEKEVFILQQDLVELKSQLKEEEWYSGQLKLELDRVSTECDKLEEEKSMVEEEFSSQLRSAEQGYLQVVEENSKLQDQLKFADYNTMKERHEKLKLQMIGYQNEAEEERQRRRALEDNFKLLQNDLKEGQVHATLVEEQLQARPSSDEIQTLKEQIKTLNREIQSNKKSYIDELEKVNLTWKVQVDKMKEETNVLKSSVKELNLEKKAKDEQITSLQTAVSSATNASLFSKQQSQDKQEQLIKLQQCITELKYNLESAVNEKFSATANLEKQLNEAKLSLINECNAKENLQSESRENNILLAEQRHQNTLRANTIKELETSLSKEREELSRLERERIELIAKIEAGEGTDTVIQQLSQEKVKLLDAITSIEKSMSEQVKQHTREIEAIRQEKLSITNDLQKEQQALKKAEKLLQEVENKLRTADDDISNLRSENKRKNDQYFQLENQSTTNKKMLNSTIEELNKLLETQKQEKRVIDEQLQKLHDDLKLSEHQQAQQTSWIETKNNAISEMTNKISNLQEQIHAKTKECTTLNTEFESLSQTHGSEKRLSDEALRKKNRKITEFGRMNEELNCQLFQLTTEKDDFALQLSKVTAEKDAMSAQLHQITTEKEQLEKVETELLSKQDQQLGEIKTLKITIDNKETESKQTREIHETSVLELHGEHQVKITELQLKMEKLQEGHNLSISQEIEKLEKLKENLQNTETNLTNEVKLRNEADSQLLLWETKYNKLESVLEQKDEVLCEAQAKIEVVELELKKPCGSCKNYEIQLCRLQEATKDQSGKIAKLQERITVFEQEAKGSSKQIVLLKKEREDAIKENEEKLRKVEETLLDVTKERLNFEEQLQQKDEELKHYMVTTDDLNKEKTEMLASITNVKEENETLKADKFGLEQDIVDFKVDIQMKTEQIGQLNKNLEDTETNFNLEKQQIAAELAEQCANFEQESEDHKTTKGNIQKIQDVLRKELVHLQNKMDSLKKEKEELIKAKDLLEIDLKKNMESLREEQQKAEQEISKRDRTITENEMKLKAFRNEVNELKGDITVLEAQIQNNNEEKRALLDRILSTEEQHKNTKQKLSENNRKLDNSLSALQELGQENQNIQVQQTIKMNRQWENDEDVSNCKKCDKQFTLTIRKHHCRNCGSIFCKECSGYSAVMSSSKIPVRVCEACCVELNSIRGTTTRRLSTTSTQSSQSTR